MVDGVVGVRRRFVRTSHSLIGYYYWRDCERPINETILVRQLCVVLYCTTAVRVSSRILSLRSSHPRSRASSVHPHTLRGELVCRTLTLTHSHILPACHTLLPLPTTPPSARYHASVHSTHSHIHIASRVATVRAPRVKRAFK